LEEKPRLPYLSDQGRKARAEYHRQLLTNSPMVRGLWRSLLKEEKAETVQR